MRKSNGILFVVIIQCCLSKSPQVVNNTANSTRHVLDKRPNVMVHLCDVCSTISAICRPILQTFSLLRSSFYLTKLPSFYLPSFTHEEFTQATQQHFLHAGILEQKQKQKNIRDFAYQRNNKTRRSIPFLARHLVIVVVHGTGDDWHRRECNRTGSPSAATPSSARLGSTDLRREISVGILAKNRVSAGFPGGQEVKVKGGRNGENERK